MSSPIESLLLPNIHYHHLSQQYWIPDSRKKWIKVSEASAKRAVLDGGYGKVEIDNTLLAIQREQNVEYAAKLAGYQAGFYKINGNNVLVTESPVFVEPKEGPWPLLQGILEGMLNVEPVDQRPYLFGWLKRSLESVRRGNWTPGQVLAFAGKTGSAKSLLQAIITVLLGGRSAKPYKYMSGQTNFNAELFQAEHQMLEDETESVDYRARQNFASHIKMVAVNKTQQCHGKNRDGLVLTPIWRMTISLNDDPERLLVLPPIEDDISDKIMLFKAKKEPMPMPTGNDEEQAAFWQALLAELPAFVDFLNKYEIPEELKSPRFGITHYHHPEFLQALDESSPERKLLEYIDQVIFPGIYKDEADPSKGSVDMTAANLETRLTDHSGNGSHGAALLFRHSSASGVLLGRLAKRANPRVTKRVLHGQSIWTITPPVWEGR